MNIVSKNTTRLSLFKKQMCIRHLLAWPKHVMKFRAKNVNSFPNNTNNHDNDNNNNYYHNYSNIIIIVITIIIMMSMLLLVFSCALQKLHCVLHPSCHDTLKFRTYTVPFFFDVCVFVCLFVCFLKATWSRWGGSRKLFPGRVYYFSKALCYWGSDGSYDKQTYVNASKRIYNYGAPLLSLANSLLYLVNKRVLKR